MNEDIESPQLETICIHFNPIIGYGNYRYRKTCYAVLISARRTFKTRKTIAMMIVHKSKS